MGWNVQQRSHQSIISAVASKRKIGNKHDRNLSKVRLASETAVEDDVVIHSSSIGVGVLDPGRTIISYRA